MIRTFSNFRKRVYSCSGDPFVDEVAVVFDVDGNTRLEIRGKSNLYAKIQSYKDSCDVNLIMDRFAAGDQTALMRDFSGSYCDITMMPKNAHDAMRLARDVDSIYNGLGDDMKKVYSSRAAFLEAFGSSESFDAFLANAQTCLKDRIAKFKGGKSE